MNPDRPRLQERVFGFLAEKATARPWRAVTLSMVLVVASIALAAWRLELKTSNLDLVDPGRPVVARFRDFAQTFGTPNMLVVVLEGEDGARLRAAADRTAEKIREAHGIRAVFARLPYNPLSLVPFRVDPYFTSRDGKMCFLFVQPADPDSSASTIAPFVQAVRAKIAEAHLGPEGVRAGLTGLPQYALDDRDIIQRDTSRLSALSFLLVLILFAASFSEVSRPLMAALTLALSAVFVIGVVALVPGHLTLVSATFFSALFGLGIDYGTYVVDRFEEHLAEGWEKRKALVTAVRELGPSLVTGSLTTAVAFYTMLLSGFRGFQELGWIGGTGILIALFLMVTLLPALLMLVGGRRRRERPLMERRIGRFLARVQSPVLAVLLAVAALVGLAGGLPGFDGDYLNLQPRGSEAVRLEREMVRRSDFSPQFAAFIVDSPDKAKAVAAKLRTLDTVGSVRSSADLALLDAFAMPIPAEREAFRASFESKDGRLAVYAYPHGNVWDPRFESRFLRQMRSVDPNVTGMPVLGRFMIDLSKRALLITAALSAIVILLLVLLDLRSPAWSVLALLPTVLSVAATLATMRLLKLDFNPLNVMALPVTLGTVVDAGAHIVHRFREEQGDLDRTLAGTGGAVLLCIVTTIVGFAALMYTTHRGLASFGIVLTVGSVWSLIFTLLVLPALLKLVAPRLGSARRHGGEAMNALSTADPYVAFTRRFFARWSPLYDLFAKPIGFAYEAAVRKAEARPGRTVLDVCTGTGEIALRCARQGARVTAVDLTPSMLLRAVGKARHLPIRFAGLDARALPFKNGTFDAVLLSFALHDMPRRVRGEVLREAARVARDRLVVLDYDVPRREPWRRLVLKGLGLFETPYLAGFARHGGAAGAIAEAGLTVREAVRPMPGLFAVYGVDPSLKKAAS